MPRLNRVESKLLKSKPESKLVQIKRSIAMLHVFALVAWPAYASAAYNGLLCQVRLLEVDDACGRLLRR